jgi:tetratricopeptide (TPR) repeat protein
MKFPRKVKPASRIGYRARRVFVMLAGLALAYSIYAVTSGVVLWRNGQQLDRDIHAEVMTDPDAIWTRWADISKGNPQALALFSPRRSVKKKLVAAAERVIETYRNSDTQPVYENDWKRARLYLARVLEMDPADETVRGELRLCEGQIDRINGISHHNAAALNEAVQKFEEAEQALPQSPDPELGLVRVYVSGLKDIDKAYAELQEAEKRGYKLGSREKGPLADGYRDRGDRLWWDSRDVRGLPQEKDQIRKAADDYRRALELYQSIVPYSSVNGNIVRVQSSLSNVEYRLAELQGQSSR